MEGAFPARIYLTSAVLSGFREIAVTSEHRIDRSRDGFVSLENSRPHLFVAVLLAQLLELIMQIEHQCWGIEPARGAASIGVKANYEKCLLIEAQRKVRIVWIAAARSPPSWLSTGV